MSHHVPPAGVLPAPDPDSAPVALLRHEILNDRISERRQTIRRVRVHSVTLAAGTVISVWLLIWHQDVASVTATGVAPMAAELWVRLRSAG